MATNCSLQKLDFLGGGQCPGEEGMEFCYKNILFLQVFVQILNMASHKWHGGCSMGVVAGAEQ
jgi:hypothetical protein